MKTFRIEIKVHFSDPEKEAVVLDACRQAARDVLATAILIADKSKPKAILETEDFIEGVELHELNDGDDQWVPDPETGDDQP